MLELSVNNEDRADCGRHFLWGLLLSPVTGHMEHLSLGGRANL